MPARKFFKRHAVLSYDGTHPVYDRTAEGLRMTFHIEKSIRPEPNTATITVWNLNEDSRAALQDNAGDVLLEVGYGEVAATVTTKQILVANVRTVSHERDNADWVSTITCGDGERAQQTARVSTSLATGSPYIAAIKECLKAFEQKGVKARPSLLVQIIDAISQKGVSSWINGFTADGSAATTLEGLLSTLGLSYSVQDGEMTVSSFSTRPIGPPIEVSADTGLIGSPIAAERKEDADTAKTRSYIVARSLLIANVLPADAVILNSERFAGTELIAEKVTHMGDTHGNDWYTELELFGPNVVATQAAT